MVDRTFARRLTATASRAARGRATPFYLFEPDVALERMRQWRKAAGADTDLFYPWKCNRHGALVDLAESEGLGAEATAADDLEAILGRFSGSRVLYQGPAKRADMLELAIAAGAWLIADSEEDAEAILAVGRALGIPPRYLLRFRPPSAQTSQRAFGLAPERALEVCARLQRARRPLPEGLSFHLGTGIPSPAPFVAAVREAGQLAAAMRGRGMPLSVLNVGGGFAALREARRSLGGQPEGRPAFAAEFLGPIREAARQAIPDPRLRLFAEPGRAIASDAFHLVTRVLRVVGRRVYVDASRMSHAYFVPRGRHPFLPIPGRAGRGKSEIAGPLPVDLDRLSNGETVGRPKDGDLLVVAAVGAYNLIAANAWAGTPPAVVPAGLSASRGDRRSGARTRRSRRSPRR
jgi:diaminopimelate decarboxylase